MAIELSPGHFDNPLVKTATDTVHIERAIEADAKSVASILREAFTQFEPLYTKEAFAATSAGADGIRGRMREGPVWIAVHGVHRVGTASAVQRDNGVYVRGMAVLQEARGLGIGRLLLCRIEAYAKTCRAERLFLSTTPFLLSAIRLYQDCGFRRTDVGPHDLFGTPLFTMEKSLADPFDEKAIPRKNQLRSINVIPHGRTAGPSNNG